MSLDEGNSYGFIIGTDYGPNHVMEFLYSNQQTDLKNIGAPGTSAVLNLDVEYFQIGGSQIWSDKKLTSFLVQPWEPFTLAQITLTSHRLLNCDEPGWRYGI